MIRRVSLFIVVAAFVAVSGVALSDSRGVEAASLPQVLSISPQSGPTVGGTVITIHGQDLAPTLYVDFDGQHVVPTSSASSQLTVVSPQHSGGIVHLRVVTSAGMSPSTAADNFTYLTIPLVTSVVPSSGSVAGGAMVTISGVGMTGVTEVLFGATSVAPYQVNSTSVIAFSPGHAAGAVHVRVRNGAGTSPENAADQFMYIGGGPQVTSVSPSSSTTAGGEVISIAGSGFLGASSVGFGTKSATPFFVSDSLIRVIAPSHAAGTVHLRVTTPLGTSPDTPLDDFIYTAGMPVVQAISPRSGPVLGGTEVTIDGTGFSGATAVLFGGQAVVPSAVTETRITVVAPAHVAGVVHLLVVTPKGTSQETVLDDFTYGPVLPQVQSIFPSTGPASGGTLVSILGSGFSTTVAVAFGDQLVTPVFVSATELRVVSPPHPAGRVHLRVITPSSTSAETPLDDFMYGGLPVVVSISPTTGSAEGGTEVLIKGSGFTGARAVSFGDVAVIPHAVTETEIRVIAPRAVSGGIAHLRVTTEAGVSAETSADNFIYVSRPIVSSVTPRSTSVAGGVVVVIRGSGFTGATVVVFGGVSVAPLVVTDTEIQVVAPAHTAGVVHLRITSTGGTSPDSPSDDFTYVPAGPELCPAFPFWVDDTLYGNAAGGFYWDPVSGLVWTATRNWHRFAPVPPRNAPQPLWVNAPTYGSPGGGFYWDSVSWQVWTAQRGWHSYDPQGCVPR